MITTALPTTGWRLLHNGVTVLSLSGANTVVTTLSTVYDAPTKAACLDEIARLSLVMPKNIETIGPIDPPTAQQVKDAADAVSANSYAKLTALRGMTPAQVQVWVAANVTNLAQAQDAIATLAIAVSILARRL